MKHLVLLTLLFFSLSISAQHATKIKVPFPKVGNYEVLKCDFHIHTSFSDGLVWPTERISEAYHEDLDAIAITDHLEIQRYKNDIQTSDDLNRSYEIAEQAATNDNIILIKGTEITRDVPPGHTNAIFITDAAPLFNPTGNERASAPEGYELAVRRAKQQGAFVFYNHPFHQLADDKVVMPEAVNLLITESAIGGMEVVNGDRFCREAYDWAIEKNLTLISNSDVHTSMPLAKEQHNISHRAMTLVFANKRSPQAIQEALEEKRTLIWWRDYVVGRSDILEPFVKACIPMEYTLKDNMLNIVFENIGAQKFTLEPISTDEYFIAHPVVLLPHTESKLKIRLKKEVKQPVKMRFRVINAWTNYQEPLIIEYIFN